MILRLIFHFEWNRGYRPHISIKRVPYHGKIEHTRGWGYRRLQRCEACSGDGYFDVPIGVAEMEQNHPVPAPSLTETDEQELQREMDETFPGSWQRAAEDVVRQNTPLRMPGRQCSGGCCPDEPSDPVDAETLHRDQYQGHTKGEMWGRPETSAHYGCFHDPYYDGDGWFYYTPRSEGVDKS